MYASKSILLIFSQWWAPKLGLFHRIGTLTDARQDCSVFRTELLLHLDIQHLQSRQPLSPIVIRTHGPLTDTAIRTFRTQSHLKRMHDLGSGTPRQQALARLGLLAAARLLLELHLENLDEHVHVLLFLLDRLLQRLEVRADVVYLRFVVFCRLGARLGTYDRW